MFIVLSGIDACGKSTQMNRLADALAIRYAKRVGLTREPGGTPFADEVRKLILENGHEPPALATLFLFMAARVDHAEAIRLLLANDALVLSDRYAESSFVYQGADVPAHAISHLHFLADCPRADLTIVLDIDPEIAVARIKARGEARERDPSPEALQTLRQRFLDRKLTLLWSRHVAVVDGSKPVEAVTSSILTEIAKIFPDTYGHRNPRLPDLISRALGPPSAAPSTRSLEQQASILTS